MTTDIILSLAIVAALILNAMQASKAAEWRRIIKDLRYQIDILTRPIEDDEAVHLRDNQDKTLQQSVDAHNVTTDWLRDHPGVMPKPGYERKRR